MSDSLAVMELQNVTLGHDKHTLFTDANLCLLPGSLTILAGANGHGKTTLLRSLLGLQPVQRGHIKILGSLPEKARKFIGYMPQDRRLPAPQMTGRSVMAASWRGNRFGLPGWGRRMHQELDVVLSLTGADTVIDRPLSQLSGGERQRLFLAEALIDKPPLLLLDEPLSGMDTQWQQKTMAMLHSLCRESGMAVLMSCHGIDPVRPYIDHIMQIANGSLELHDAAL